MTTMDDDTMGELVPPTEEHPATAQVSWFLSTVWGGVGAPHESNNASSDCSFGSVYPRSGQGTAPSGACIPDPVQGTASAEACIPVPVKRERSLLQIRK